MTVYFNHILGRIRMWRAHDDYKALVDGDGGRSSFHWTFDRSLKNVRLIERMAGHIEEGTTRPEPGVCRGNLNGFVAADADNADTAFSAWRGDRTNGIFHGKVHASG
jgi:hypothetical protein